MAAYAAGTSLDAFAEAEARAGAAAAGRISGTEYRLQFALPPIGPGSWRLAITTVLHPTRHAPSVLLAGWLPRGFISTAPIQQLVERFIPGRWPEHPSYWAVAADYASGPRVAFGGGGPPPPRAGGAGAPPRPVPAL